jgi:hypothetical protein
VHGSGVAREAGGAGACASCAGELTETWAPLRASRAHSYADTRRPIEELTVDSGSRRVAICERDREFEVRTDASCARTRVHAIDRARSPCAAQIDIDLPGRYRHEEWAIAVAVNGRLVEVHKSNPFDEREGHYIRIAFPTGLKQCVAFAWRARAYRAAALTQRRALTPLALSLARACVAGSVRSGCSCGGLRSASRRSSWRSAWGW